MCAAKRPLLPCGPRCNEYIVWQLQVQFSLQEKWCMKSTHERNVWSNMMWVFAKSICVIKYVAAQSCVIGSGWKTVYCELRGGNSEYIKTAWTQPSIGAHGRKKEQRGKMTFSSHFSKITRGVIQSRAAKNAGFTFFRRKI